MEQANDDKPLILLVDDNDLIRTTHSAYLADTGFNTLESNSADAALGLLERHPRIAAVVTDITMPGVLDGEDLARWLLQRRPTLPVILISARRPRRRLGSAYHRFVLKPYSLDKLDALLRELLANQRATP